MTVTLVYAGAEIEVDIPLGSALSAIRDLEDELQDIGAPSSYTMSINGQEASDETTVPPGARVGFRPIDAKKG